MKKCISIPKALSIGMVLLTILFSNLVLSSTQIFAQTASDNERETALRSRQYIELIGSILALLKITMSISSIPNCCMKVL